MSARENVQDQAINKFWLTAWFIVIPCQFGCVAAYGLNEEFKTLMLECKNGVVAGVSYVLAKTILVLPLMLIFGVFALGIPFYAIMDAPVESFFHCIVLFACAIYIHESVAECISAWFEDVIIGTYGCFCRATFIAVIEFLNMLVLYRYASVYELLVCWFPLWRLLDSPGRSVLAI